MFQQPKKLVPEWHQLFANLEPRTAYFHQWLRDYHDQQDQNFVTAIKNKNKKQTRASVASSLTTTKKKQNR